MLRNSPGPSPCRPHTALIWPSAPYTRIRAAGNPAMTKYRPNLSCTTWCSRSAGLSSSEAAPSDATCESLSSHVAHDTSETITCPAATTTARLVVATAKAPLTAHRETRRLINATSTVSEAQRRPHVGPDRTPVPLVVGILTLRTPTGVGGTAKDPSPRTWSRSFPPTSASGRFLQLRERRQICKERRLDGQVADHRALTPDHL